MAKVIDSFRGEYECFRNPWSVPIYYEGVWFPSTEHAFHAAKTEDIELRKSLVTMSWRNARSRGRAFTLRPGWEEGIKNQVMEEVNWYKYTHDEFCRSKLLSTRGMELIEGNWWGDTYWGVCDGVGENHLGRILMQIRMRIEAADNYVEF